MPSIGIGIGIDLTSGRINGPGPIGEEEGSMPSINKNLLLWTENFDNSIWTKTGALVTADQATGPAPSPGQTADEFVPTAIPGAIYQTTSKACTTAVSTPVVFTPGPTWARYSITGTIDGSSYTWSVYVRDTGSGASGTLTLDKSGGFLRVGLVSALGDADFMIDCAQLEAAAAPTTYQARTT